MTPMHTRTATPHPAPSRPLPLTVEESRLTRGARAGRRPARRRRSCGGRASTSSWPSWPTGSCTRRPRWRSCTATVRAGGRRLWTAAVDRAQGRAPAGRPRPVRRPPALLGAHRAERARCARLDSPHLDRPAPAPTGCCAILDRTSRGIDALDGLREPWWPDARPGELRVMVSGFDVFGLDDSVRHSNPSGAPRCSSTARG